MSRLTITGLPGVMKSGERFEVYVKIERRRVYAGTFSTLQDAVTAQARCKGLSEEDIQKKMVDVFGTMSDEDAQKAFHETTDKILRYFGE